MRKAERARLVMMVRRMVGMGSLRRLMGAKSGISLLLRESLSL